VAITQVRPHVAILGYVRSIRLPECTAAAVLNGLMQQAAPRASLLRGFDQQRHPRSSSTVAGSKMDFSYFTAAPQPYGFFGMHDASNNDHSHNFDNYHGHITAVSTHASSGSKAHILQDQYDAAFAAFQQNFHYDPNTFLAQPQDSPQPQSPNRPQVSRHDSLVSLPEVDQMSIQQTTNDLTPEDSLANAAPATARSSSEEKDTLTPQQSRRKAQNRAA
jgi:hypothetical protein